SDSLVQVEAAGIMPGHRADRWQRMQRRSRTMKKGTYRTEWGSDTIEISADWSQAACIVDGVPGGRQVADFRHCPREAMRAAVEHEAKAAWLDLDDPEVQEQVNNAVE